MIKQLANRAIRKLKAIIHNGVYVSGQNNSINIPRRYHKISISINGNNNIIHIPDSCLLTNTIINISGNNCVLEVSEKARFIGPVRINIHDGGKLFIGENCGLRGVRFEISNKTISLGKLVMFSYNILIRNHDSHKIFNTDSTKLINEPKDIKIGDHVWIAESATILKGVEIGHDSVIGFGSIVTKNIPPHSIAVGIPAKVTNKEPIIWDY